MKTLLDAPIHKMLEDLSVSAAAKIVSEYVASLCPPKGVLLTTHICREVQPKKPAQLATNKHPHVG